MMDLRMTESNLLVGRTKSSHDICKKRTCQKAHFADISIRPVAEDGRNQRSGQKATRASFYWQGLLRHLTFLTSRSVYLLFVKWSGPSIFSFLIFLVCISGKNSVGLFSSVFFLWLNEDPKILIWCNGQSPVLSLSLPSNYASANDAIG